MCFEGKCCGLKLETGTLIFGVISSVFNALSVLGFIGGIIAFNVYTFTGASESYNADLSGMEFSVSYSYPRSSRLRPEAIAGIEVLLAVGLLKSVMNFAFSVCLCNGVNQRKHSLIRAYFIYGVVMVVLASIGVVVLTFIAESFAPLLVGFVGVALYGLILHMIRLTHQKMTLGGQGYGFEHKPLEETVY